MKIGTVVRKYSRRAPSLIRTVATNLEIIKLIKSASEMTTSGLKAGVEPASETS